MSLSPSITDFSLDEIAAWLLSCLHTQTRAWVRVRQLMRVRLRDGPQRICKANLGLSKRAVSSFRVTGGFPFFTYSCITYIMHRLEIDNLDSLLSDWLNSGRRSSPHTQEAYRRDVRAFIEYSRRPITEIQPADVINYQAYLRHQVGSPATEYRKLSALRSFFKYLRLTNQIKEDLSSIITAPKVETNFKSKALSVDEIAAIIEAAKPNPLDSLLLRMLYVTGGRISEVLALTWSHLKAAEIGGGYAHILGKGKKEREVYIGP